MLGTLAVSANMRSMARLEDGSDQALVEAKAVDGAYPLYGQLVTEPALPRPDLFADRDGIYGAAAPDLFFERLGLAVGGRIKLGGATFELARQADLRSRTPFRTVSVSRRGCCVSGGACAPPA